jgi:hypothetical protein
MIYGYWIPQGNLLNEYEAMIELLLAFGSEPSVFSSAVKKLKN